MLVSRHGRFTIPVPWTVIKPVVAINLHDYLSFFSVTEIEWRGIGKIRRGWERLRNKLET
jgi:hypothetical protein